MFAIDEANPFSLEQVGEPILLPGEFPNTVAASEKNGLVCVGLTGKLAGISCAAFSAEGGLGEADDLREFQLGQSTPPVGPTNTVSQVFWSDDESHLLATVKGDPEKGNNGFFSAYAVLQGEAGAEANFAGANGLDNKNQTLNLGQGQNQLEAEKQANKYKQANDPAAALAAQGEEEKNKDNKDNKAYNQANQLNPEANKQENNLLANATGALFGAEDGENQGGAENDAEKQAQKEAEKQAKEAEKQAKEAEKQAQKQGQNNLLYQAGGQAGAESAFAISAQNFYLSRDEIRSTPEGTAVLFGSVAIPGTQNVLATDASFGVAVLSLLDAVLGGGDANKNGKDDKDNKDNKDNKNKNDEAEQLLQNQDQKQQQQKSYQTKGRLELPGQKATCWAAISPLTNSAFVTDVGRNKLIEVGGYNADVEEGQQLELSIIGEIDLSAVGGAEMGLIDLRAAGQFVYALSPGTGENGAEAVINVVDAGSKEFVQNAKLGGVGAGKKSMGMGVYI